MSMRVRVLCGRWLLCNVPCLSGGRLAVRRGGVPRGGANARAGRRSLPPRGHAAGALRGQVGAGHGHGQGGIPEAALSCVASVSSTVVRECTRALTRPVSVNVSVLCRRGTRLRTRRRCGRSESCSIGSRPRRRPRARPAERGAYGRCLGPGWRGGAKGVGGRAAVWAVEFGVGSLAVEPFESCGVRLH